MERQQAEQILERTLSYRRADHLELSLGGSVSANTRFANSAITQNTSQKNAILNVTAAFGQKVGHASTNKLDTDALRDVVARAEQIAKNAEPDTEYLPPVGPSKYAEIPAYDEKTAVAIPQVRAEPVHRATKFCGRQSLKLAGHFTTGWRFHAIANSEGVFGYHRSSSAGYASTVMTEDSSGWAESRRNALDQVQPMQVTRIASEKALRSQQPREVPPGDYTVIMEPAAAAELLSCMFYSMDAKAAHEERSAFTGKEGTKIGTEAVHIYSRPQHPECPSSPFFGNGIPTMDVDWIQDGVLKNLSYSRYWAQHTGHAYTGGLTNFIMDGTDASLDDLIASVDKGILITRFWYIRSVDPMKLLLTGMTRDGLFWIENGEVQYGIRNLRFNESPLEVIANIEMLGSPVRVLSNCYVPPLKVRDFTFTSGTSF